MMLPPRKTKSALAGASPSNIPHSPSKTLVYASAILAWAGTGMQSACESIGCGVWVLWVASWQPILRYRDIPVSPLSIDARMILFELKCKKDHHFEGWFRDGKGFETQTKAGKLVCPVCGSRRIEKAMMAPRIGKAARTKASKTEITNLPVPAPAPVPPAQQAEMKAVQMLREMRKQ